MPLRRAAAVLACTGLLVGLLVGLAAGCGSAGSNPVAGPTSDGANGAIPVVASTNVYGSIAAAIGGQRIAVRSLVSDPAADPHSYESTPSDAAAVAKAALVIVNGGGYDDWMPRLVESAGGDRTVIDVAQLSGLAGGAEFNEHLWYHLPTVQRLARTIADDLAAADPAHAAEFRANAESFDAQVGELLARAQRIGAARPGARVAVTEPVPGYLVAAAGLTDATPPEFTAAIEEDTDPPAAVLRDTLALFAAPDPVRALIVNAQTQTPTTDQLRQAAQTSGVPIVEVTETLPAAAGDYLSWMGGQIDALSAAVHRS